MMLSLEALAVTLNAEVGTTPTTEKMLPLGFQHLEHPHAWLCRTSEVSVTSTLLEAQWQ